jgi:cation transport protein ChaC
MWVFGYGSLMWDGWEAAQGCIQRQGAKLSGYRRTFNKASVKNWGTKTNPCPTLNLIKTVSAHCHGMAFEFPDETQEKILAHLTEREGKGFKLLKLPVQLNAGGEITAICPVYEGNNFILRDGIEQIAERVFQASGKKGKCVDYVKGIADELTRLGIDDPAVSELWRTLVR